MNKSLFLLIGDLNSSSGIGSLNRSKRDAVTSTIWVIISLKNPSIRVSMRFLSSCEYERTISGSLISFSSSISNNSGKFGSEASREKYWKNTKQRQTCKIVYIFGIQWRIHDGPNARICISISRNLVVILRILHPRLPSSKNYNF